MKSLFLVMLSFIGNFAHANFSACSKSVEMDPRQQRAIEFLRPMAGQFTLGKCAVELHVCDSYLEDDSAGTVVGDIQITDHRGHVSYIQLDFVKNPTALNYSRIQNGSIMFHYEFYDRNKDPQFGRTESVRIEFLKSRDKTSLVSIEAGVYSTEDWMERNKKFTTYWSLCHGKQPIDAIGEAVQVGSLK